MEQIQLDVFIRNEKGTDKIRRIRRENFIPAVVYGEKVGTKVIKTDRKIYESIMRSHQGESVIFNLNLMDGTKKLSDYPAIVKEVQIHPVTDKILHIDFHQISLEKEIEIKVPILTKGEAVGIKRDGGTLEHSLWELDIICLPTQIPHHIEVDISNLGIHQAIHVKDLTLPKGSRTKHDPDSVVVSVVGSMKEFEPTAAVEGEVPAELEVIKEKKKEPEEADAAKKTKEGDAGKKPEAAKKEEKK